MEKAKKYRPMSMSAPCAGPECPLHIEVMPTSKSSENSADKSSGSAPHEPGYAAQSSANRPAPRGGGLGRIAPAPKLAPAPNRTAIRELVISRDSNRIYETRQPSQGSVILHLRMTELLDMERRLRGRLEAFPRAARAELLHVLMLPDFDRAGRIGEFWCYPESRGFAELLIDLEEDRNARAVVGMLREEELRGA